MYKETVKPIGKTVFFVIGIGAAALLVVCFANVAFTYFNLPYRSLFQLASIVIAGVGAYILIRNMLTDYTYSITDSELIIEVKLGSREWVVSQLPLEDIEIIAFHSSPVLRRYKPQIRYNAKKSFFSFRTYVCCFNKDGKPGRLKFEPSKKLLEVFEKKGVLVEK